MCAPSREVLDGAQDVIEDGPPGARGGLDGAHVPHSLVTAVVPLAGIER